MSATPAALARLRELKAAATKGPWEVRWEWEDGHKVAATITHGGVGHVGSTGNFNEPGRGPSFIPVPFTQAVQEREQFRAQLSAAQARIAELEAGDGA